MPMSKSADEAEQIMVAAMDAEARERLLVTIRQRAFAARQKAEASTPISRLVRSRRYWVTLAFIFLGFMLLLVIAGAAEPPPDVLVVLLEEANGNKGAHWQKSPHESC